MANLTASELKTKGIGVIETALAKESEAFISVHGKERYVVLDVKQYHYLRECELEAALAQSRADVAAGRFTLGTVQEHLDRLESAT